MDNKKLNFYKLAIKENEAKTLELLESEFVRENVTMGELESNFDGFKDKVLEDETIVQSELKAKFENAKANFVLEPSTKEKLAEQEQTIYEMNEQILSNFEMNLDNMGVW